MNSFNLCSQFIYLLEHLVLSYPDTLSKNPTVVDMILCARAKITPKNINFSHSLYEIFLINYFYMQESVKVYLSLKLV
jgi:hypothetical protein